jgi:membrane protein DedA with SNARE-associated domain
MNDSKKWDDKKMAAVASAAVMVGALIYYWIGQGQSTVELLELAYGSFKFFNNPLVF